MTVSLKANFVLKNYVALFMIFFFLVLRDIPKIGSFRLPSHHSRDAHRKFF